MCSDAEALEPSPEHVQKGVIGGGNVKAKKNDTQSLNPALTLIYRRSSAVQTVLIVGAEYLAQPCLGNLQPEDKSNHNPRNKTPVNP